MGCQNAPRQGYATLFHAGTNPQLSRPSCGPKLVSLLTSTSWRCIEVSEPESGERGNSSRADGPRLSCEKSLLYHLHMHPSQQIARTNIPRGYRGSRTHRLGRIGTDGIL